MNDGLKLLKYYFTLVAFVAVVGIVSGAVEGFYKLKAASAEACTKEAQK